VTYHYAEDAPTWRQIADTKQRARKWYDCQSCPHNGPRGSAMIPPGQEYRKIVGLEDDDLVVFRECCGPCPNAEPCLACNATGESNQRGHACGACDGTGKVRRANSIHETGPPPTVSGEGEGP